MSERSKADSTPVDGIIVLMTWHCGICKQNWTEYIDQGTVRRMPSYIHVKGRKLETRRPDGSMLRAHKECAERMLKYMDEKGLLNKQQKKKSRIIMSGEE